MNSIKFTLTTMIPKTDKINAIVCPIVKIETKSNTRLQSLKAYGTVIAIKNKTWS